MATSLLIEERGNSQKPRLSGTWTSWVPCSRHPEFERMSLMFPTIYGISLKGLGDDAKFGAGGLIMAILGGSVLPPLQALIIDRGEIAGLPAVNLSFVLPLVCFIVIVVFGYRVVKNNW